MEISELLQEALHHDQQRRNQAEINIDVAASHNFGLFLLSCSQILCDESKMKGVRQISSTIIKNMILYTAKYKGQWELLHQEIKLQIKQHVLSTLASSDKDIRKAAGLAVAGICKLELPIGEWQDIISILCQTSTNENKFIQLASLTTLGYISQEVTPRDINNDQLLEILSCLYNILSNTSDLELQDVALNAMLNFIPFTRPFFETKEQRTAIVDLLFKYTNIQDSKIRIVAVQCLLEIGRLYYDYIEDHIMDFLSVTKLHMVNDEESIAILCYEFWCSIGDIEIARMDTKKSILPCRHYCNKSYSQLLEVIFNHLLNINSHTEENWNLSRAASCLLSILSQSCEYQIIQEVVTFISQNINQTNSFAKEASILSFGAILETTHRDNMSGLVMNSIDTLISYLVDKTNSAELKDTTAWVIEKIADQYGEYFLKYGEIFDRLYTTILGLFDVSKRKVICHLCNAIHFFAVRLKPIEGQNSNILSKHVKVSLEKLLNLAFMPKAYDVNENVAMSAFFAIGSLIENAAQDTKFIISSFFNNIIDAFRSTLDPKLYENDKMRFDYQAYIATCIEPCLITGYIQLSFEMAKELLNLIIITFKERNGVYEEGLMAASSIGLALGQQFDSLVNDFGSFLIYSLNSVQDTSLCKTAIHSTSDLIRSIGPDFSKYLDQIIPIILGILSNNDADKILKPHSFNVISDVFIMCKDTAFNYFNNVMDLIGSALEAATFLPDDKDDFENLEYFESLREHILECLTCIFATVKDMKKEEEFKRYVIPIVNFINRINLKEYNPSLELVKNSLGLVADFCESYKGDMKTIINVPVVEGMLSKLRESKSSKIMKIVNWAQKAISMALK